MNRLTKEQRNELENIQASLQALDKRYHEFLSALKTTPPIGVDSFHVHELQFHLFWARARSEDILRWVQTAEHLEKEAG